MSLLHVKHMWFLFMTNTPNHWAWYMNFTKCMIEVCNNQEKILIKGRFLLGGASKRMLPRTYAHCTLFSFDQDYFCPIEFLLPGKVFDEVTIKRVQHHIINWWASKGECYKYYYLCGCPRKYSLVMSLWCKLFLYIRRLMRMNNTLLFP